MPKFVPYPLEKRYAPQSELLAYTNHIINRFQLRDIDTSGVLANPRTPRIEGTDTFRGASFHTAQWDHDVAYEVERVGVGVIGSGCSAAQVVPAITGRVARLTLFMGRAQWIIPRSDRKYSAAKRFVTNLPVIRHIKRFMISAYHEVRFVAFRRYPFTSGISCFRKLGFEVWVDHPCYTFS